MHDTNGGRSLRHGTSHTAGRGDEMTAADRMVTAAPAAVTSAGPLFIIDDVTQERGGQRTLDGVTVTLPRGETIALVGPSGAGKTSLLRLLNRLDDPVRGTVSFDGAPITTYPVRALRRRVGFVFQQATMFAGTVADNLRAGIDCDPEHAKGADAQRAAHPAEVLAAAGLDASFLTRDAATLSGGEQQRVSIARALMTSPAVLLLDEPTSALDPEVAEHFMRTVARLRDEQKIGIVMVTHRLAEARSASTFTVMMERGRVVEAGATETMFTNPTQERTRAFLRASEGER
jgi:ABC-type methionine transport system ATPase subunit